MPPAPNETEAAKRSKDVVLQFMRLMDNHELDSLAEVLAPDIRVHSGQSELDRNQLEEMIRMFYRAFPDFRHDVEDVLAIDGKVVLRATDRATHQGDFQGIAPTGRKVTIGQIGIYRVVDGKIAEIWEEADVMGLMQQLQAS